MRSPIPGSRSDSPVEYYDEHTHTLLDLLKNISEEVGQQPSPIHESAKIKQHLLQLGDSYANQSASMNRGPMGNTKTMTVPSGDIKMKTVSHVKTKSEDDTSKIELATIQNVNAKNVVPLIQISRTDSQRLTKFESKEPISESIGREYFSTLFNFY